jgi:hypothetical protein
MITISQTLIVLEQFLVNFETKNRFIFLKIKHVNFQKKSLIEKKEKEKKKIKN